MRRVNCSILDLEQFGEIGANFSLQISSQTQFAKISNKKVIAEINEKHKNWSLYHISLFSIKDK